MKEIRKKVWLKSSCGNQKQSREFESYVQAKGYN